MKSFFLFLAIILGIFIPQAYPFSYLIQYLLMVMLFITCTNVSITQNMFSKQNILLLLFNLGLGFIWFDIVYPFNHTYGVIAFLTAIAPTATAAPSVIHFLQGKVSYATASVLVTNVVIALLLPFFASLLSITTTHASVGDTLQNIVVVMLLPLVLAQLFRFFLPLLTEKIRTYKLVSFYAWVVVIFLATANASHFIHIHTEISPGEIMTIGAMVLVICIGNFSLGKFIGGKTLGLEASQSLGQKNTMFTVWYALTFLNPIIALGPVFYLVYHNMYNSYQMMSMAKKNPDQSAAP